MVFPFCQLNHTINRTGPIDHSDVFVSLVDAMDIEKAWSNQGPAAVFRGRWPIADQFHGKPALFLGFPQRRLFRILVEFDMPTEWQPLIQFAMMNQQYLAVVPRRRPR